MNYSGAASHQLSHSFRDLFTPDPSLLLMLLGVSPFHIQPHFIPMKVVPSVYSIKARGWIDRWGLHLILGFGVTDSSLAQFYKALIHCLCQQNVSDNILIITLYPVNFPLLICFGQFYRGSKFLMIFQISRSLNLLADNCIIADTRYSEWRRRQSLFCPAQFHSHPLHPLLPSAITKKKLLLLVFEFVFVGWVPLAIWVLLSFSACSNRFKMVALSWISSSLAFHDLADQWSLINDCVDAFGNQWALWISWELCVLHPTISSVKCISNDGLSSMEDYCDETVLAT